MISASGNHNTQKNPKLWTTRSVVAGEGQHATCECDWTKHRTNNLESVQPSVLFLLFVAFLDASLAIQRVDGLHPRVDQLFSIRPESLQPSEKEDPIAVTFMSLVIWVLLPARVVNLFCGGYTKIDQISLAM